MVTKSTFPTLQGTTLACTTRAQRLDTCSAQRVLSPTEDRTDETIIYYHHRPDCGDSRPTLRLGRLGAGDEIAAAAVYLASDEAAYVTGQTLHVNGGMAMI